LPRHPSQLYEASLEGVVLFLLLFFIERYTRLRERPGAISGVFLIGYGTARIISEFFREPDAYLGYLIFGATMGQLLSLPLIAVGLFLLLRARPRTVRA
jgi:phosphatidylglycerol:prolipoprotein diacylglycerol transferase